MPHFRANFPHHGTDNVRLLTTPERVKALPEYSGRGVVMAFIDSGFSAHPDLAGRIRLHVDASTSVIQTSEKVVDARVMSWHGQMTTVIAAGNGFESGGLYRGIAHESELVCIKVSTPSMQIKEADILRGMEWLLTEHENYGIKVVNVSVGGDMVSRNPDHPLHRAVKNLSEAGVTVVIAAGNRSEKRLVPPASAAEAIVVGGYNDMNSLDSTQWRDYPSNFGLAYDRSHKPDLIAPAQYIAAPLLPGSSVALEGLLLGPLLDDTDGTALSALMEDGLLSLMPPSDLDDKPVEAMYHFLQDRMHSHKLIHACYQHVDGTSVAAPIVSSVVACMLQVNPSLTPRQIQQILRDTAIPVANLPLQMQGAGVLDAAGAVTTAIGQTV